MSINLKLTTVKIFQFTVLKIFLNFGEFSYLSFVTYTTSLCLLSYYMYLNVTDLIDVSMGQAICTISTGQGFCYINMFDVSEMVNQWDRRSLQYGLVKGLLIFLP